MKVSELLDSPEKWTQKTYAKDSFGTDLMWCDPSAACWCLHGAICKCYRDNNWCMYEAVLERLKRRIGGDLWEWNDAPERTFQDVQQLVTELGI